MEHDLLKLALRQTGSELEELDEGLVAAKERLEQAKRSGDSTAIDQAQLEVNLLAAQYDALIEKSQSIMRRLVSGEPGIRVPNHHDRWNLMHGARASMRASPIYFFPYLPAMVAVACFLEWCAATTSKRANFVAAVGCISAALAVVIWCVKRFS